MNRRFQFRSVAQIKTKEQILMYFDDILNSRWIYGNLVSVGVEVKDIFSLAIEPK